MRILTKWFITVVFFSLGVVCLGGNVVVINPSDLVDESQSSESINQEREFNAVEVIMEHISDSNEWHLFTYGGHHYSIPLPVIIIEDMSLKIFMSSRVSHGEDYEGYTMSKGRIVSTNNLQRASVLDVFTGLSGKFIDISISKNVLSIFISIAIMFMIFFSALKSYKVGIESTPRGVAKLVEPIIVFVRDQIAIPNMGEKNAYVFLPFLLTVFFFIWINNLLGLIPIFPGGANVTGNISVTMSLALITSIIINFNGKKAYWKHVFSPPGVPFWLLPIMIPVEILGIFIKPFALMMRLFANITAGHIMILSLISLVIIFKTLLVAPASVFLVLFISMLELLVAALQAYIFTVLSALFIGMAVDDGH
ncbi:F0F1 ATP synthase subunit A [Ichthyobacterium seriolicida]|uniref:ATP synthase subunit a n=1 Tax=Ichthyobacterium seriolicida TaxID=242600 RepID=A0A1J1E749_9FLAO|nr:F0F1 ATP synthase subunit A [Ichthyobacterium seriolicida]BAV95166.1 ATP synthase F0 subunit A [Ichthyobacterium seriolicida]